MKKEDVKFLYCPHCGNIATKLYDSGVDIVCCGEEMVELEIKTSDTGVEKHLPKVERVGDQLKVTVGEVEHPMTDEHFIQWIEVVQDNHVERFHLKPGDKPAATFCAKGEADVYSYCNLHGLWRTSVK
ncbi:MAG: desulfoferrodoxin family protein [Eubacteriales bacterium]